MKKDSVTIRRWLNRSIRNRVFSVALLFAFTAGSFGQTKWTLMGWNDLGMHCMDGTDYSVSSILPPYNTFHVHLLRDGQIVTDPAALGITITYEAVADPSGSINSHSTAKVNFWDYAEKYFGVVLPAETGLAGFAMPGVSNTPQSMHFETSHNWFTGEGVPITPFDDVGNTNFYPMFRIVARDSGGIGIASNDVVIPVSDEMDCTACHASGSGPAAKPNKGWVWLDNPHNDMKLNILRLHDQFNAGKPLYASALATNGFNPKGLFATVVEDGQPILCSVCHRSNALPVSKVPELKPLTESIHSRHANVIDPLTGLSMESAANRESCYRCHPGSKTLCLRGAMGKAVSTNAAPSMSCQSCHGHMSDVGDSAREGWFNEPNCQACHSGTADDNSGQIRYTSVFDELGDVRVPANSTFATEPDTPAPGISLYRFSAGHGGLQCSACHGSPHAVYPSAVHSDNIQNINLQGYAGTLSKCSVCHVSKPGSYFNGPHGMHPIGYTWNKEDHKQAAESNLNSCRRCHGTDLHGTVLSRAHDNRVISAGEDIGTKHFWKGSQIGCYTCHNGPNDDHPGNTPPTVSGSISASTTANTPVALSITANDANSNPLTLRVVSQAQNGRVGIIGTQATYIPFPDFIGVDTFTYAAWDGSSDSNLGTGTVTVTAGTCVLSCPTLVPTSTPVNVSTPFWSFATLSNCSGTISIDWDFGDASTHSVSAMTAHAFSSTGLYTWVQTASADGKGLTNTGQIVITDTIRDWDEDSLSDLWENFFFKALNIASAQTDIDMDGFIDLHEFLAGTIPTNINSLLHIEALVEYVAGGQIIQWPSVSNKSYRILQSTNLLTGDFSGLASHISATPPVNTFTNPSPSSSPAVYYRIELE
ncbi:MAG: hypothetical protein KJ626_08980 [Verrucomicrobia bacterium]|nr:hypothetical protein [Verrucomicrobiota bacterium]